VPELAPFALQLMATDSDIPAQTLTYSLVSGPAGLTVSPSGALAWTPTEAQGPSTNDITVAVTDSVATNRLIFTLTVVDTNAAPVLAAVANASLIELTPLAIQLNATDTDLPTQTLTYSLVTGPTGLTVSPAGAVAWIPTEAQGPSTNAVTVQVSDGIAQATRSFSVTVFETNAAPVLTQPADQDVAAGGSLNLQLSASDIDLPAQTLSFSLSNAPAGMTVSATGRITWTPSAAQTPSTNTVIARATDGIETVARTFAVRVTAQAPAPVFDAVAIDPATGRLSLRWSSSPGARYRLESQAQLGTGTWVAEGEEITATGSTTSASAAVGNDSVRLFRVVRLP
jgi:large repetitive protein